MANINEMANKFRVQFFVMGHCNECFNQGAMMVDATDTPICPVCGEEALRDTPKATE